MKNILVFNVNWIGDVIFSSPVFKALRKAHPEAKISCIAVPRVKEVLDCIPFIDEVIVYDEKGVHRSLWNKVKLIFELRRKKFDVAFLLHRSLTRALLVFFCGIKERVGYNTKNRGWLLTTKVEPLASVPHRSDFYINVIESYGVNVKDRACELKVDPDSKEHIDNILNAENVRPDEQFVVVNPGGNWDLKRWPKENFGGLVKRIFDELQMKVVISGAAKDKPLAKELCELSSRCPINLAGKTDLKQTVALMARARVVISSDSGPMHIANCVGTDTVAIFGPTIPAITGPRGTGRVTLLRENMECNKDACYNLGCADNICMKAVVVDDVFNAVKGFLEN